jgi:hypothetical protein
MATKISKEEFEKQKVMATQDALLGLGEQRGEEKFKQTRIYKLKEQLDIDLTSLTISIKEEDLLSNYVDVKNNLVISKKKELEKGFSIDTNKVINDYVLLQLYIFFLNETIAKNEKEMEQDKDHIEDLKSESESYIEEIEENENTIKALESKINQYENGFIVFGILFVSYIIYDGPIHFFTNIYNILGFILTTYYDYFEIFTPLIIIPSVYYLKFMK